MIGLRPYQPRMSGLFLNIIIRTGLRPVGLSYQVYFAEFVSYLGERGVLMCVGNGSYFCTPVLVNMCNIRFQVFRLGNFIFIIFLFRKTNIHN